MRGVIKNYKGLHELVLQTVKDRNKDGSIKHFFFPGALFLAIVRGNLILL